MAKARLRRCIVTDCTAAIPAWLHFCDTHYKLVPGPLKKAIHDEYREMRRAGARHSQPQDALVVQAKHAVLAKLFRTSEKRREKGGDLYQPAR